jgi:hypothetical protein
MGFAALCESSHGPVIAKVEKKAGGTHLSNEIAYYTKFAHSIDPNKTG